MGINRLLLLVFLGVFSLNAHPKLLVITGEASGDQLGAWYLQTQCKKNAVIWALGGDAVIKHAHHVIDTPDARTLGITSVGSQIRELLRLWSLRDELVALVKKHQITHAVLVDFPLMNLFLARRLHNLGVHVTYIAPPELWLWRTWGLHHWLQWYCDDVIVLYPFEQAWYQNKGLSTSWHGWPRQQTFEPYRSPRKKRPLLALLPGSRATELTTMVPLFTDVAKNLSIKFPDLHFAWMVPEQFQHLQCFTDLQAGNLASRSTLTTINYDVLASCCAALCKPGTITLELALLHVPSIIAFTVPWLTYTLASWCAQLPWVGLPNIMLNTMVMPELLQENCTTSMISKGVETLIQEWYQSSGNYQEILDQCSRLHQVMHPVRLA